MKHSRLMLSVLLGFLSHEIWESKKAKINAAVFHKSMAESYARDLLKLLDMYDIPNCSYSF